jgi:hypothetical protein
MPASEEYDWFRVCVRLLLPERGDVIIMDFGRPLLAVGLGEAVEFRAKGLFRTCPEFEAILYAFHVSR